MNSITNFELDLMKLNPRSDNFVIKVDQLLEQYENEDYEPLIPAILSFFEKHPVDDCGAPGTLVHLIENYYPNYVPQLIESVNRRPTYNTILMINRILNSELTSQQRQELMRLLNNIKSDQKLESELRNEAADFIEYQNN